jgi:maltose alpha-D-glucosyltransferase/alpha-amylase
MFDGDLRRVQLAHSLLLTLPGTPVLWYGDEIGMGEDLGLGERESVRTPMQWSSEQNGGFSRSPHVVKRVISEGPFSFERVNVAAQRRDPDSLLSWMERMIRMRKECPEIGWGRCETIETHDDAVLATRYDWAGSALIALHNFSRAARSVDVDLGEAGGRSLVDVLSGEQLGRRRGAGPLRLDVEPYGFRWLRVGSEESATVRRVGEIEPGAGAHPGATADAGTPSGK